VPRARRKQLLLVLRWLKMGLLAWVQLWPSGWTQMQYFTPKRRYLCTRLQNITSLVTGGFNLNAVRIPYKIWRLCGSACLWMLCCTNRDAVQCGRWVPTIWICTIRTDCAKLNWSALSSFGGRKCGLTEIISAHSSRSSIRKQA
jgi:hypothetical protein